MVGGGVEQCFKDAATPLIYDKENETWKESTGLIYNKESQAWEEHWSEMTIPPELMIYDNGNFGIAGQPSVFPVYFGVSEVGTLTFNSDNFRLVESSNSQTSVAIFPIKIDFSKNKYVYIEVSGYSQTIYSNTKVTLGSTNYFGSQQWRATSGERPYETTSLSGIEDVGTTERGYIRRIKCTESAKEDYLGVFGSTYFGDRADLTVYKIWLEK